MACFETACTLLVIVSAVVSIDDHTWPSGVASASGAAQSPASRTLRLGGRDAHDDHVTIFAMSRHRLRHATVANSGSQTEPRHPWTKQRSHDGAQPGGAGARRRSRFPRRQHQDQPPAVPPTTDLLAVTSTTPCTRTRA